MPSKQLIAVDIGNTRLKFGLFKHGANDLKLPAPASVFEPAAATFATSSLEAWLAGAEADAGPPAQWWIASVNRGPTDLLTAWLRDRGGIEVKTSTATDSQRPCYRLLAYTDLGLRTSLRQPERVGIDRLLGAVAANQLRGAGHRAIVIDVGSAITVDLISPQGAFLGGAILPGIGMSVRAMHNFTDRLPLLPMDELADPPPALGTSTIEAMQSGLYWGALGAMKELISRLTASQSGLTTSDDAVDIFLTGGAAPTVARFLDPRARFVPHLVLGGIALVSRR